ncbi:MAG: Competence-damaged protein [Gemmatimonadetes bacterium]|jgi:nicotinamide-nucleotide amidase|nr:Competence-damaged protein [Gemmatimonadota bacterium]
MRLELLTVGTELLLGLTIDTNSAEIARVLASIGVEITRRTSVGDDRDAIQDAVGAALDRAGTVLVTGGLGPTRDDITKHAVAELLHMPLEFQEEIWHHLVERFRRLGREPAVTNRSQAEVPRGATALPNRWGTAPGLWLETPRGLVIMLPGVPIEMRNLLTHEVVPRLAPRAGSLVVRSRTVRTSAIPESTLAERLGDIEAAVRPLGLAYLPGLEGVDLRLTSWGAEAAESDARLDAGAAELRRRAGAHVYGEGEETLADIVVGLLRARGLTIGVAESCTGGLLGGRLTDVPGSSEVFRGGIIAYDNSVKVGELEVPAELLRLKGAVSEPVALAMAEGVRRRLSVDVGVGITGIAGPGGGTADKPTGTVCLAVAGLGDSHVRQTIFPGSRPEVRARAVQTALFLVRQRLLATQSP